MMPGKSNSNILRVLLVDDNQAKQMADALTRLFRKDQHVTDIQHCDRVDDALEKLGLIDPHVIITDLDFGPGEGMAGIRLLDQTQSRTRVVLSAYGSELDQRYHEDASITIVDRRSGPVQRLYEVLRKLTVVAGVLGLTSAVSGIVDVIQKSEHKMGIVTGSISSPAVNRRPLSEMSLDELRNQMRILEKHIDDIYKERDTYLANMGGEAKQDPFEARLEAVETEQVRLMVECDSRLPAIIDPDDLIAKAQEMLAES